MNGMLNILKPPGMTSFDVVAYLRGLLKTRKIGHSGTLDPEATGVIQICVGNATKVLEFLVEKEKKYRAELTLGITTDTQDASGTILKTSIVNPTDSEILNAILSFKGEYYQKPPMYSAIRVDGKRLYELARAGKQIDVASRLVNVLSIDIVEIFNNKVIFDVECSKGTYIRTLCHDIGEKLGCGGHMSFLIRTKTGMCNIEKAITLEELKMKIENTGECDSFINIESILADFDKYVLNKDDEKKFLNGVNIKFNINVSCNTLLRVYNYNNDFIALGEVIKKEESYYLKSRKFFN